MEMKRKEELKKRERMCRREGRKLVTVRGERDVIK